MAGQILADGTKTVTAVGFAERLSDLEGLPVGELEIMALGSNTGVVYVGTSDVSATRGTELRVTSSRGDVVTLMGQDPRDVWLDVSIAGEGVKWIAYGTTAIR